MSALKVLFRAHLCHHAAHRSRSAATKSDGIAWARERDRRREELWGFVIGNHMDPDRAQSIASGLLQVVRSANRGHAAKRTLDELEELLWRHGRRDVYRAIRTQRAIYDLAPDSPFLRRITSDDHDGGAEPSSEQDTGP
jgi:hypothetical protein